MDSVSCPIGVTFDRKITLVLEKNIPPVVAMNVASHLAISLGAHCDDIMGENMVDLCGQFHLALCKYPVVLLEASFERIKQIIREPTTADVIKIDFPIQALDIWTDAELVRDIAKSKFENLEYYGVALCGIPRKVNKLTGDLKLWKSHSIKAMR